MTKILASLLLVLITQFSAFSQSKEYPFFIYESMPYGASMKKMSNNALSIDRFVFNAVKWDSLSTIEYVSAWTGLYIAQLALVPIVHEEGHRSVLTSNNIGSVSRQFFDKNGIATVTGLTDQTLQNFRNSKLPEYIRLHTAGLESEYVVKQLVDEIVGFREDEFENTLAVQTAAVFGNVGYQMTSLFPSLFTPIRESDNELENDIVGHDLYGMVKHLYRPNDSFYRYTNYDQLTRDEKNYIRNGAYSSFINLLSPSYLSFKTKNARLSFGAGFLYTPFGKAHQLSVWYLSKNKASMTFSTFSNKVKTYPGLDITLKNIHLRDKLNLTLKTSLFRQPKDLSFTTTEAQNGYLVNAQMSYLLKRNIKFPIALFLGVTNKSKGFVVGETFVHQNTFANFGMSFFAL